MLVLLQASEASFIGKLAHAEGRYMPHFYETGDG